MASNVGLPGLQFDRNRHGRPRWYYVHKRRKKRLQGVEGEPPLEITHDVRAAYDAAKAALHDEIKPLAEDGTMEWLAEKWFQSGDYKRLDKSTRDNYRNSLNRLMGEVGDGNTFGSRPFVAVQRQHVRRLVERVEGHSAANFRLKTIRRLFNWATAEEILKENPARDVKSRDINSQGFIAWEMHHLEQFVERHPPGTKPWLALQLHLYTAARRSDVVEFGPINIRSDRFRWVQAKNRNRHPHAMDIPFLQPLREALRICEPILGETTFLVTEYGKPFKVAGYGNKFRGWMDAASMPKELSSHGIRKLVGINAALNSATAKEIQEVLGHSSIEQGETYVRQANRLKLANTGFAKAWLAPT